MNICVVGTGYVGLVTGAVFADLGNDVICVDKATEKIEALKQGRMPIYEPGLEEMVTRNVADGRLSFTTDLAEGVRRSEIIFIAVGTPPKANGETDLSAVDEVARGIGRAMDRYKVIVNKSTVPVGTGDLVREIIQKHQAVPVEFDVVSNPEFLREGSAIEDTLRPDRIVIGAPSQQVALTLLELYAPLERPMIITDVPSAEMIKYASNSFLAAKISFINTVANICELAGADVTQVTKAMGLDPRIGPAFLQAGLGYDFKLLRAVVETNRDRAHQLVDRIRKVLAPLDGKLIGILGLAFKPNTDDMREAKSIQVIARLTERGATVRAYDPVAMDNARTVLPAGVVYCDSPYAAAAAADGVALVTEWNEFKYLNLERLRQLLRRPVVFDGRNLWEPERMRRLGFEYHTIGRRPVVSS